MGRTSDARERILEAGAELFGQRAYSAIGVSEICTAAGVPKGSFYYFFPSKQALVLEVVNVHWVGQRSEWTSILSEPIPLIARLRNLFEATAQVQRDALAGVGSVTGCLFGNLALEVGGQDVPVRERVQEIFEEQIDLIDAALRAAIETGELPEHIGGDSSDGDDGGTRSTAKAIVAQLEGLVLFARLFNDPAQLDQLWRNSLNLLRLEPAV